MKIKKPEIVPMFKCSSGPPVETLDLWKHAELCVLLDKTPNDANNEFVARFMIGNAEQFLDILGLKEKGRPNGAKDKVKRKTKADKAAEAATAKVA